MIQSLKMMKEALQPTTEQLQPRIEQLPSEGLNSEEDQMLAGLLSKCTGRLSTQVYTEYAAKGPQPIIELVILRENKGVIETLLIPRPKDDIVWPGMVHNPGSALRNSDYESNPKNPEKILFTRLENSEVKGSFAPPTFVKIHNGKSKRGYEIAQIYFTEMLSESNQENHQWYPVDQLSQNPKFIQSQLEHIQSATEAYSQYLRQNRVNL